MSMNWKEELKGKDAVWQEIEAAQPGASGDDIPDGTYVVEIVDVNIDNAKSSGRLQFIWDFKVLEGEHKDATTKKFNGLDTPERLSFFKGDLATVGLFVPKLSDINLAEFIGRRIEIQVKTRKKGDQEYRNVYINKLISLPDGSAPAAGAQQNDFLAGLGNTGTDGPFA